MYLFAISVRISISGGFIFTILLGKYEKKTLNFAIQAFSASFAKKML